MGVVFMEASLCTEAPQYMMAKRQLWHGTLRLTIHRVCGAAITTTSTLQTMEVNKTSCVSQAASTTLMVISNTVVLLAGQLHTKGSVSSDCTPMCIALAYLLAVWLFGYLLEQNPLLSYTELTTQLFIPAILFLYVQFFHSKLKQY